MLGCVAFPLEHCFSRCVMLLCSLAPTHITQMSTIKSARWILWSAVLSWGMRKPLHHGASVGPVEHAFTQGDAVLKFSQSLRT